MKNILVLDDNKDILNALSVGLHAMALSRDGCFVDPYSSLRHPRFPGSRRCSRPCKIRSTSASGSERSEISNGCGMGGDMDMDMIVNGLKDEHAEKPLLMSE